VGKVGGEQNIPGITNHVNSAQAFEPQDLLVIGVHVDKHVDRLALHEGAQITAHHVDIEDLSEAVTGVLTDLFKQATEPG
jgi:hypothetical protein